MSGKKKRRVPIIFFILLIIIVGIPLGAVGWSFIGRITPDSVIPDSYNLYASVPDPVRLAGKVMDHEPLPEIMALAELAPLIPMLNQAKGLGLTDNRIVRYAARGRLDAAFLSDGIFLGAWDMGIVSPLLRFLPVLAGRVTIPGLYYVQAGKNSRFEYRLADGTIFFIGPYKNLLVFSNNSALYESVIAGSSRDGDRFGSQAKRFNSPDYDIAFLLSEEALRSMLRGNGNFPGGSAPGENASVNRQAADPGSEDLISALNLLQFPGPVQLSLSVFPNQLKLHLSTPLGTDNQALLKIIEKKSPAVPLSAMIPDSAQYLTLLSAGSLPELFNGASAIASGTSKSGEWENAMRKADNSARMTLGMNLEELLFSWTGTQFAIYGLEGRPNPVIMLEISDEIKRKEVFDKAFRSIFLTENIQLTLDGNRIPRIQIPGFLNSFLEFLDVHVPSPYYTVQGSYLYISESAETLLAAVNAFKRNEVLPKTDLWRTLSEDNSGPSSFTLFYSLDRSLPFFLKGGGTVNAVLRLYRQGLAALRLENKVMNISLAVIPGAGRGIVPVPGYPLDLMDAVRGSEQGRVGSRLYGIFSGRDTRLIITRGSDALVVNPLERTIKAMNLPGSPGANFYIIPAVNESSEPLRSAVSVNPAEGAAWAVNSQGQVSLVNRDLENLRGFPLPTGIQLSAPPGAWGGKLILCGEDGLLYTVDNRASVNRWGNAFSSPHRSPPFFLDFNNYTYAAVYPKSFFGEIFILNAEGRPLPFWPVPVSGIAFGSPLLFTSAYAGENPSGRTASEKERLYAAFITQPGELAVYSESAEILSGFPIELPGVFYLQPVFDGENLWIIESEGTLYRVSLDGEIYSQKIPRLLVREEGYITVADIDGDKKGEIFFSGDGNALHGYSQNFSSLEGFPLPVWGRPVFGDLNSDGKTEIAGVGMDNKLYMWQFR